MRSYSISYIVYQSGCAFIIHVLRKLRAAVHNLLMIMHCMYILMIVFTNRCSTENSRFNSCVEYAQSDEETHYIPVREILEENGEPLPLWMNTTLLIGFMIVVRLLTYVMLRYLHRPK